MQIERAFISFLILDVLAFEVGRGEELTLDLNPQTVSSSERQEKNSNIKRGKKSELNMCNPVQSIVDVIVDNIVKTVFKSVGRHVGFLFHYKQNVKNLEDEKNNLQQQRSNVQEKVNEANHRGEAIYNNVSDWLKDVDKTREGVDKFMDEKTVKENIQCFNFSCSDFIWRYRLSKQAEKKAVDIKHLAESGSQIGPISHPRENPPELELPSSKDYEDFDSRQKVLKDIVEALKDSKVNMIGVYGTGGVGKTTMVEKVGKLLKEDGIFNEVVMAVVSKDANVRKIQGQLADNLNLTLSGETEIGRAKQLWKRLDNGEKNLIILDDVWHELDLKEIGIPIKDGNKRCKVVLTSRNRDVWKNMDVNENFQVEFLTEEEAWPLVKKKVGNHVDSHDDPRHDIALAICKECQGLPVAINAIGAALKGKDIHAWKDALDKLKNSMLKNIEGIDQKVYASLKWSYDQLESEDAKSCFLLCCLFAEDAEIFIDDLVRYYMARRTLHRYQMPDTLEKAFDRVCTVVDTLKSCSLLLDGESKHLVKMHDVVRDIAISIAEDEKSFLVKHGLKDWPEKAAYERCSVISLRLDDVSKFPDELVCLELHTLRIDCANNGSWLEVPDEFFIGTGNLMVLDLEEVIMSPLLPASLAKLAKLQMLCLNQCNLGDISILKDLKDHLEILSLRGSNIEVLPPEVGELTHLRLLDMSDCDELQMIPKGVISKLFRLEELRMPMSFGKWEGTTDERGINNASLDELMSLTRLTTLHIWIPNAALLPRDLSFENLVRFDIIISKELKELEDYRFRHFRRSGYTKPLTGILILGNFHVANTLEFLLGKPKRSIPRNGLYPSIFISHLMDLSVSDCGMKYLFSPSCARELVGLQRLMIQRCGVMEGVIETEKDKDEDILIIFSGLKTLHLKSLPSLISFYPTMEKTATSSGSSSGHAQMVLFNDKVTFPALESLEISSVEKITEIWDKQMLLIQEIATESPLCELSNLEIKDCSNLMNVVGGSPKLEAIVMDHKHKGKEVDDYHVTRFPKLKNLVLWRLRNLESFCSRSIRCEVLPLFDHQATFPALESLEIESVEKITEIWDKQMLPIQERATESPFCELSKLEIYYCSNLMNVVGGSPKLEAIVMDHKHKGKAVDDYHVTRFPKLKNLGLRRLRNLESFCSRSIRCEVLSLFDHQASFPALESLEIESVEKITEIWDKQMLLPIQEIATESPFCELSNLKIDDCSNLMNVVGGCPKLEVIATGHKEKGKEVDDYHVTCFPKLKNLWLEDLKNLESFCSRPIRCEVLPLFDHQVEFPVLEELFILTLPNITVIWDKKLRPAESFRPLLRELHVYRCPELVNVVQSNMLPEEVANIPIVLFPELKFMGLAGLENIKSFYIFRSGEQLVFNAQVAFPKLENLFLDSLGERALQQLLGAFELLSLKCLELYECDEVSTMSSPHFLRSLRNVGLLKVTKCEGVREVFHFDGLEVGDGQECVGRPSLIQVRMVQLNDLPQLTCLWNKDPRVLLDLQNLEYLTITNCPLLANLFTASVAKALGGLKGLCLSSCSGMEVVITTDEEGHKDVIDDDHEIEFPKLERLILEDLPKLKSFCGSNHNLNFPSLRRVVLKKCPEVQTFTSGSVRMPQIRLTTSGNDGLVIEDLNKPLEQQHLKGDQEIIWGISDGDGGGYDYQYYHLPYFI